MKSDATRLVNLRSAPHDLIRLRRRQQTLDSVTEWLVARAPAEIVEYAPERFLSVDEELIDRHRSN